MSHIGVPLSLTLIISSLIHYPNINNLQASDSGHSSFPICLSIYLNHVYAQQKWMKYISNQGCNIVLDRACTSMKTKK